MKLKLSFLFLACSIIISVAKAEVNPILSFKIYNEHQSILLKWDVDSIDPNQSFIVLRRGSAKEPFKILKEITQSCIPYESPTGSYLFKDTPPTHGHWQYQVVLQRNGNIVAKRSGMCLIKAPDVKPTETSPMASTNNLGKDHIKRSVQSPNSTIKDYSFCLLKKDNNQLHPMILEDESTLRLQHAPVLFSKNIIEFNNKF